MNTFGQRRICYINFASHLLNAYNPNMLHLGLPYRWADEDWFRFIDMIAGFGFTTFEFWLEPRLFCREGLVSETGAEFTRQMNAVIDYAAGRGIDTEMLAGLATVGSDWRTLCPNLADDWREIQRLWQEWTARFPNLAIIGIFPGDPGACSRNGCTAETYIDRSIDIAHLVKKTLPRASVEFGTWGPPYFGWGNIRGPQGWQGEFIPEYQHTAWDFDRARAERSMDHLARRLPDFPPGTAIALNMGFNSDGNPTGDQDARPWVREIARTHPVLTWDFSLTEGENAIFPHYRFDRLFARRREERSVDVDGNDHTPRPPAYTGGICFTMTPRLNQLSLYESAQSFLDPDASHAVLAENFYARLFGERGRGLAGLLPLMEVVPDWGHYVTVDLPRPTYHARMTELADLLRSLDGAENVAVAFHPRLPDYRRELLFFAEMFRDLSAPAPDFDALRRSYWRRVYAIYDQLPTHVDPRPHQATDRLIGFFRAFGRS